MDESITREVTLAAAPEEVWAALTDPDRLSEWFGADAEIDPRAGGAVSFHGPEGTERRGLVELAEPASRLVFRWRELHRTRSGLVTGEASTVEFHLERDGDGTRLVVIESPGLFAASGAEP